MLTCTSRSLAYRQQLAPVGESQVDYLQLGAPRVTAMKIARVRGEHARRPAFALVEYEEDADPTPRRAGRAALSGASELGRQLRGSRLLDDVERAREQEWVNSPDVRVRFVRWIESPAGADFETIADDKAIDVDPGKTRRIRS